tara:strand:- start:98 stop:520 length:423 start_codon:yes stop_codon:yes gene_type:complete
MQFIKILFSQWVFIIALSGIQAQSVDSSAGLHSIKPQFDLYFEMDRSKLDYNDTHYYFYFEDDNFDSFKSSSCPSEKNTIFKTVIEKRNFDTCTLEQEHQFKLEQIEEVKAFLFQSMDLNRIIVYYAKGNSIYVKFYRLE